MSSSSIATPAGHGAPGPSPGERFAAAFGCRPHGSSTEARVAEVERALGCPLPGAYRRFILRHGTLDCPGLLNAVVDAQATLPVLQTMTPISDLLTETEEERGAGLPDDLLVIGTDPSGHPFCLRLEGEEGGSVLHFDHDLGTLNVIAPDFDSLLAWYADLT